MEDTVRCAQHTQVTAITLTAITLTAITRIAFTCGNAAQQHHPIGAHGAYLCARRLLAARSRRCPRRNAGSV